MRAPAASQADVVFSPLFDARVGHCTVVADDAPTMLLSAYPTMWCASIAALDVVAAFHGCVFDARRTCRQGGWCWLAFLDTPGLTFEAHPTPTYLWTRSRGISVDERLREDRREFLPALADFRTRHGISARAPSPSPPCAPSRW